jgi:hypothetical protein
VEMKLVTRKVITASDILHRSLRLGCVVFRGIPEHDVERELGDVMTSRYVGKLKTR